MEARTTWLEKASNVISDLRQKRVFVPKLFPNKEHLRPVNSLSKRWKKKVCEFFNKDPANLVSLHKVSQAVSLGRELKVEEDGYQMRQLKETMQKGLSLKKQLEEFIKSGSTSYAEAKYYFGELFTVGVRFPQAGYVRDIVKANILVETTLSEPLTKEGLISLQSQLRSHKKMDPELVQLILQQCQNYELLDIQLTAVLTKPSLDFNDLGDLEEVDRQLRISHLQLPRAGEFADLFQGFSWAIKTALEAGIRATNLAHALAQLRKLLERRLLQDPKEIVSVLTPVSSIEFSISPIKEFMDFAKMLLWRANVKVAFGEDSVDLSTIEELVTVAPRQIEEYHEACEEFYLVEGVLKKSKDWRKNCNDFVAGLDSLFDITSPDLLKQKILNLGDSLASLRYFYKNEDLKMVKNLNHSFEQLTQSERMLRASENIAKMLGGDVIHLTEFLNTVEIIKKTFKDDKKYSVLMHQFQKIQRDVIPSLDELNKISNAISSDSITPKGMKPKDVLQRQHRKVKALDIDYHLEKLSNRLVLDDLGSKVKRHLKAFFEWEKQARTLVNHNSIKTLLGFTTKEQVGMLKAKSRELRRNIQSSNLFSEMLSELITYEWCLKVVEFLKLRQMSTREVRGLIDSHLDHQTHSKNLLTLLKTQIVTAKKLVKFCEKCKKSKPTAVEVESLKEVLKGFKIAMPKKRKFAKTMIQNTEKIKEKIQRFLEKPKPRLELVEAMVESLRKESVLFEKFIRTMKERINLCKKLVKQAKNENERNNNRQRLLKRYKKLDVFCPEFEKLVRENQLDSALVEKYEAILKEKMVDFKKIEAVEMEIEMVDDFDWAKTAKIELYKKKISMLRDAVGSKYDLRIDMHDLKNLARDGFHLFEHTELQDDIAYMDQILHRAEKRMKLIKTLPIEKVKKLKRVMLNCVDISKEVEEAKQRLLAREREKDYLRGGGVREKETKARAGKKLGKREKKESKKHAGEGLDDVRESKKLKLKSLLEAGEAEKEGVSKPKKIRKGSIKKAMLRQEAQRSSKVVVPEFRLGSKDPKNSLMLSPNLAAQLDDLEENLPKNNTGVWGVFEGGLKLQSEGENNTINLAEIKLVSYDSWKRIREFPKLPITPHIRDTIKHSDLADLVQKCSNFPTKPEQSRVLAGVVSCEGLARLSLNSLFKEDKTHYCVKYSKGATLVFVSTKHFEEQWFRIFSKAEEVKELDCDYYWLIFTKEKPQLKIQPVVAQPVTKKVVSNFNKVSELRYDAAEDEEVPVTRRAAKMSTILGINKSAVNQKVGEEKDGEETQLDKEKVVEVVDGAEDAAEVDKENVGGREGAMAEELAVPAN